MAITQMPKTPNEIRNTGQKLFKKHKEQGETSPLRLLKDVNYDALEIDFQEYERLDEEAKKFASEAKRLTELRDKLWSKKIKTSIMRAKDMLLVVHNDNPASVEQWGFPHVKNPSKVKEVNPDTTATEKDPEK